MNLKTITKTLCHLVMTSALVLPACSSDEQQLDESVESGSQEDSLGADENDLYGEDSNPTGLTQQPPQLVPLPPVETQPPKPVVAAPEGEGNKLNGLGGTGNSQFQGIAGTEDDIKFYLKTPKRVFYVNSQYAPAFEKPDSSSPVKATLLRGEHVLAPAVAPNAWTYIQPGMYVHRSHLVETVVPRFKDNPKWQKGGYVSPSH